MWMFSAGEDPKSPGIKIEINSSVLQNSNVMAFKISPDGTRMALVRNTKEGPELGLARIIRSAPDKITVDGLRPLDLMQANKPQIASIADVAWLGATTTPNTSFQVVQDASRITAQGGPENSNAVQLAALPGTQSSIIVGRDGRTWKDDGNQWLPFLREEVGTIAYPG